MVSARTWLQINQRNAEFRPFSAPKPCRRLGQHHLERRAYGSLQQMAATGGTVRKAEHDMHVQAGLAVVSDRHIADGAQDLALLVNPDFLVSLGPDVEPA